MLATAGKLGVEKCKEKMTLVSKLWLRAQAAFASSFYQFGICVDHFPFIKKEFGFRGKMYNSRAILVHTFNPRTPD